MSLAGVPRCCKLGSRWCRAGYTRSSSCTIARGQKGSLREEGCIYMYIALHYSILLCYRVTARHLELILARLYSGGVPAWLKMYFFCTAATLQDFLELPGLHVNGLFLYVSADLAVDLLHTAASRLAVMGGGIPFVSGDILIYLLCFNKKQLDPVFSRSFRDL